MDCYKGLWRRNFCGHDLFWNDEAKKCDHLQNVPECFAIYKHIQDKVSQTTTTTTRRPDASDIIDDKGSSHKAKDEYDDEYEEDYEDVEESGGGKPTPDLVVQNKDMYHVDETSRHVNNIVQHHSLPATANQKTFGKVCVVKNSQLICQDPNESVSSSPAPTSTTTMAPTQPILSSTTTTTTTLPPPHKNHVLHDKHSKPLATKPASSTVWELKIEIKVDESVIRLVRIIAYYFNFTINF